MNDYSADAIIKELYYTNESNMQDGDAIREYIKNEEENNVGLEMPDMLSNINGTHIYKLLSAKDIDFNNVLLRNSNIDETMWGGFDKNRRWPSGYPIHINDAYELMNVVDYLLCATKDLWSELNKMKYNSTTINNIWFLNDLNNPINSIYALSNSQFVKGSEYCVYLDPTQYYATLPLSTMSRFGIGTYFVSDNNESIIRNVIQKNNNRNGINGYIENEVEDERYHTVQTESVNGQNKNIYGYLVQGLKFYPMFNIENYLFNRNEGIFESLVDHVNMKMNYDVYFRTIQTESNGLNKSIWHKVYVDFLYYNYRYVGFPYILYYIDETSKKRHIIYIHTTENQPGSTGNKLVSDISYDLRKYSDYINFFYGDNSLNDLGSENNIFYIDKSVNYPYLYYISDVSNITLFVETPNTANFNSATANLVINYYKKQNNINYSITTKELSSNETVLSMPDIEQPYSLSYCPNRYYLPDQTDIYIKVNAPYMSNNPNIKKDDEYMDVLVPVLEIVNDRYIYVRTDEEAKQYYYYTGLNEDSVRQFTRINSADELNNMANSATNSMTFITDIDQQRCLHLYKKNTDCYKLSYNFTTNQLVKQAVEDMNLLNTEVENVANDTVLHLHNNDDEDNINYLKINHILNSEYEQIKFDIRLNIAETSKVSDSTSVIPVSLNKIHRPSIQFIGKSLMEAEINDYVKYAYSFGDAETNLPIELKYTNKTTTPIITTRAGNTKTNQNIVNGVVPEDQFYTFKEIYEYVIKQKYNDFYIKDYSFNTIDGEDKRTDLLYYINYNDHNNIYSSIYNSSGVSSTYDNTISGSNILTINYNPSVAYLGIFGDINQIKKQHIYTEVSESNGNLMVGAFIETVVNQNNANFSKYKTKNAVNYSYITFNNIFNINGLGFNYRLHGGDSYLYINRNNGPRNINNQYNNKKFEDQYDLTTNVVVNDLNNICKFLEVGIDDGDNQFNTSAHMGSELYKDENDIKYKIIANSVLDINLFNDEIEIQKDGEKLDKGISIVSNVTYYSPCCYMTVNSTTFYPDKNILPDLANNKYEYDLNNSQDVIKYNDYINFWDSETNEVIKYKPITLSLQLKENLTNNVPFFNESNIAKVKFNIKRVDFTNMSQTISLVGKHNSIIFGERYYLSELLNIANTSDFSIGSYPKYDEDTEHFEIKEFFTIPGTGTAIPIEKNDNSEYQYNVEKCSLLNKIKFDDNIVFSFDDTTHTLSINNNPHFDFKKLFYIDFTQELLDYIVNTYPSYDLSQEMSFTIHIFKIFGTKLYKNNVGLIKSDPQIHFKFIIRQLPETLIDNDLNAKITTASGDVVMVNTSEPFEFKGQWFRHYQYRQINGYEIFEMPQSLDDVYYYSNLVNNLAGDGIYNIVKLSEYPNIIDIQYKYIYTQRLFENYKLFIKTSNPNTGN